MHQLTSSQLAELATSEEAARLSVAARERLGWIAYFVQHRHSVSETCLHLGISRSTFHRWLERFDPTDLTSLEEKSHEPHTVRSAIVPDNIITLIRAYRQTHPHMGKDSIRDLLQTEHGLSVSASTIGRVIERECLYFAATPLHWKKRMHSEERNAVPVTTATTIAQHAYAPQEKFYESDTHTESKQTPNVSTWRNVLIVSSVLVNIAIGLLFLATIAWESHSTTAQLSSTNVSQTEVVSSLNRP